MAKLRIICFENDYGTAMHIGGKSLTIRKTFDVECPPDLAAWLGEYLADMERAKTKTIAGICYERAIDGVEFIQDPAP